MGDVVIRISGSNDLGDSVKGAVGDLKGLGAAADEAGEKSKGLGSVLAGFGAGIGMAGFNLIKDSIGGIASGMIDGAKQFETYKVQFGVMLAPTVNGVRDMAQGAVLAKERMKELADFGAKTPFDLPEVVQADKILQGFGLESQEAAKKFGFSASEIRTIAGDVASGAGTKFSEMAGYLGKFASGATGEAISRFQELGIITREQMAGMGLQFSKAGELLSPLPEAMNVVLTAMKEKYGGMMDQQSATLDGMLSNLQDAVSGTLRGVGEAFLPQIKDLVTGAIGLISGAQPVLIEFGQNVGQMVNDAVTALQPLLPVFQRVIEVIKELGGGETTGAISLLKDTFTTFMSTVLPALQSFITDMVGKLQAAIPQIVAQVTEWGNQMVAWVAPFIPPLFAALTDMATQLMAWLAAQIPPLIEQLAAWANEFIAWVAPFIPSLFAALTDVANQLMQWLADQIPPLIEKLKAWAAEFIAWVAPLIPPLLLELGKVATQLVGWLGQQIPVIIAQLLKWAAEFVAWVAPLIPPLLLELAKVLVAITGWIVGTAIPGIVTAAVGMATAFIGWVANDLLPKVGPALGDFLIEMKKAITDDIIPGLVTAAKEIGDSMLRGIGAGIEGAKEWLKGKVQEAVNSLPQWARDLLGISSPSKVFEEIGGQMAAGLGIGFGEGVKILPDSGMKNSLKDWGQQAGQAFADGWTNWMATWNPMQGNVSIGGGGAPGAFRPTGAGGGLGGFSGSGSLTPNPWAGAVQAGFRNLAEAFSPGAFGSGQRSDVEHQINVAEDQLKELQNISKTLDLQDKANLRANDKQQALLEGVLSGRIDVFSAEGQQALVISRGLVGNPGGQDNLAAALKMLQDQATKIKEDAIDRKIAQEQQTLQLNKQLDSLKDIKTINDAQLNYLSDIAANTAMLVGGGRGVYSGAPGAAGASGGGIGSRVIGGTGSGGGISVPITIQNLNVSASSVQAGQAAGRAVANELEYQLADAMRRRNIGL